MFRSASDKIYLFLLLSIHCFDVSIANDYKKEALDRDARSEDNYRGGMWFGPRLGKRSLSLSNENDRQLYYRMLEATDALKYFYEKLPLYENQADEPDTRSSPREMKNKIIFTPKLGRSAADDRSIETMNFTPRLGRRLPENMGVTVPDQEIDRSDPDQVNTRSKYFSPRLGRNNNFSPRLGRDFIYDIITIIINEANGYVLLAANVDDFRHIAKKIISKKVVDKLVDTIGNNKKIRNIEADNDKVIDDHVGLEISDVYRDNVPVEKANFEPYGEHVDTPVDEDPKNIRKGYRYNIKKSGNTKDVVVRKETNPTENWDDKPFFEDVETGNPNKKGEDHLFYDKFDLTGQKEEAPDYGPIVKDKPVLEKQYDMVPGSSETYIHETGRFKIESNKERHMQPDASREQFNDNGDQWKNKDKHVYESGRFKIKHNKESKDEEREQRQYHEETEIPARDRNVQKKKRYETYETHKYESEIAVIPTNNKNKHNKEKEYSLERTENVKNIESREWDQVEGSSKLQEQRYKHKEGGMHREKSDSKENKRRPKYNEMKEKDNREKKYDETRYGEERHPKLKHQNRENEESHKNEEKPRHKYIEIREENSRVTKTGNNKQKHKYVDSDEVSGRDRHVNNKEKYKYVDSKEENSRDRYGNNKQKQKHDDSGEEKSRDRHGINKQKQKYGDSGEEKTRDRYGNNKQKEKYDDSREDKNRGRHDNIKEKDKYVDSREEHSRDRYGNNKQKHKYVDSGEDKNLDQHGNNKQKERNEHRNKGYNSNNDKFSNKDANIHENDQMGQNDNKGRIEMISNEDDDVVRPNKKKSDSRNTELVPKMGTMRPKGVTRFKQASPNYYLKDPNIADKYDFNEPIPEHDRDHENTKDIIIGNNNMKINGKLKS